eukprot:TRINITY_DN3222_c0_g1_i1.p1 TRINITY_DN3222_c0_g1~~TRINITY_DN3222_c0_g1_i1.p1  ORF type:complete len:749 (-),score=204.01 TRINITY_DN3222_c0_g1_i1:39-2177(-)
MRVNPSGLLEHLHWGEAVLDTDSLVHITEESRAISFDPASAKNAMQLEFADFGTGDFRRPSILASVSNDGSWLTPFVYQTHRIVAGKPSVDPAQPELFVEDENEADTLVVVLADVVSGLEATLYYTVFAKADAIVRRVSVRNVGTATVTLHSVMSATLDLPVPSRGSYTLTQLSGAWARERLVVERTVDLGTTSVSSTRGASSHQHNPFIILSEGKPSEESGRVFGFHLVYSGGFLAEIEAVQTRKVRVNIGINPETFQWILAPNETFVTPEAVLSFSGNGLGSLSRMLHRLFNKNLIKGVWKSLRRPVLINSWEAMYFDVTEEKILNLAAAAAPLGIELVVLDDGWFGQRNDDTCCLGDWTVNTDKFPSGLSGLAEKVNQLGLSFGIWMEPEMVSEESDLFRTHPEWTLRTPNRPMTTSRNQLVLDLSRQDVRDFIVESVTNVLNSANITFLKWDFNRHLTEVYSVLLPAEKQRETYHRFVLGVYDVMSRLTQAFPNVLFESCSGGGGRYDLAMMQYMPQVWTSDNSDAVSRTFIQYGSSLGYPVSQMSAHVAAVPSHQTSRTTPLRSRHLVAMGGQYGYEFDLDALTPQELSEIEYYVAVQKEIEVLVRTGDMYRLSNPYTEVYGSWMHVNEQRDAAVVFVVNSRFFEPSWSYPRLRLSGLDPTRTYRVVSDSSSGQQEWTLSGKALTHVGLVIRFSSDVDAIMFRLQAL